MLQGKGLQRCRGTEGPAWGKAQERGVSAEPPGCEQINGAEQRQSFVLLPCPCHGAGGGGAITLGAPGCLQPTRHVGAGRLLESPSRQCCQQWAAPP